MNYSSDYCPQTNPGMTQIRAALDQMKSMGFSDWDIVSKVVLKYNEEGKLNELDHIASEIDHITNLQNQATEEIPQYSPVHVPELLVQPVNELDAYVNNQQRLSQPVHDPSQIQNELLNQDNLQ